MENPTRFQDNYEVTIYVCLILQNKLTDGPEDRQEERPVKVLAVSNRVVSRAGWGGGVEDPMY